MKRVVAIVAICGALAGCMAPAVQGNRVGVGWTGQGWYHPDKSPQEMVMDLNQCKAQAWGPRVMDSIMVEMYCMQGKGYAWQ